MNLQIEIYQLNSNHILHKIGNPHIAKLRSTVLLKGEGSKYWICVMENMYNINICVEKLKEKQIE